MRRAFFLVICLASLAPIQAFAGEALQAVPEAAAGADAAAAAPGKNYNFPPNPFPDAGARERAATAVTPPKPLYEEMRLNSPAEVYPISALREELEGSVGIELVVSKTGQVIECTVTQSSGHLILDRAACRGAKLSGRYTPAKNAAGEDVNGLVSTSIVYALH